LVSAGEQAGAENPGKMAPFPEGSTAHFFGLFSLLVAFTFSGAAERYDHRRQLIAEETNNIGTAWLREDLLSTSDQLPVRELFRRYLDSRLQTYRKLAETPLPEKEMAESVRLQDEIWKRSVVATSGPGAHQDAGKLLLPALNAMIDITTTRAMATLDPPACGHLDTLVRTGSRQLVSDGPRDGGRDTAKFGPGSWLCRHYSPDRFSHRGSGVPETRPDSCGPLRQFPAGPSADHERPLSKKDLR
jgi:hypothetical protein